MGDGRQQPPRSGSAAAGQQEQEQEQEQEEEEEEALPACTLLSLSESGNAGGWVGDTWHPSGCRPNRITPREALECLDQKNLLVVGDFQMANLFAELLAFLGAQDRCRYLQEQSLRPQRTATLRTYKAHLKGQVPYVPGSEAIPVLTTQYGNAALATYYGTESNGFGIGKVHFKENTSTTPTATTATEDAATSTGTASEGERVLKVVYVAHTDSREPMFRHWMVDYRRPGPLAHSLAPFDHVLVTGGLHDVVLYSTPEDFATNLEAEYVPSLRFSVRNMSRITWAGMWSLHEQKQQRTGRQARLSSKLRSFAFDDVARKMAKRWGMNWLSTRYMTTPRPDLSADGTRYSWPISLATIELWLGSICPSSSHEPSRC